MDRPRRPPAGWPDVVLNRLRPLLAACAIGGARARNLALATRAANGSRTRDLKLGKLALYQLSYRRADGHITREHGVFEASGLRQFAGANARSRPAPAAQPQRRQASSALHRRAKNEEPTA
jgi:hypothetical protein